MASLMSRQRRQRTLSNIRTASLHGQMVPTLGLIADIARQACSPAICTRGKLRLSREEYWNRDCLVKHCTSRVVVRSATYLTHYTIEAHIRGCSAVCERAFYWSQEDADSGGLSKRSDIINKSLTHGRHLTRFWHVVARQRIFTGTNLNGTTVIESST